MNREEAKEWVPLITAFAEGKTIQFDYTSGWGFTRSPAFFAHPAKKYRVKPEPRVVYINSHKGDYGAAYETRAEAAEWSAEASEVAIKFVEEL